MEQKSPVYGIISVIIAVISSVAWPVVDIFEQIYIKDGLYDKLDILGASYLAVCFFLLTAFLACYIISYIRKEKETARFVAIIVLVGMNIIMIPMEKLIGWVFTLA